jgi:hypothetical protein
LSLGLAVTVSDATPSADPGQVRRDGAPPARPGDDLRMSGMRRLAHRLATGELKRKIRNALDARLGNSVRPDEEDGPAGGRAESSIAIGSTGQHVVVGVNDTRGFSSNPSSVSGFMYSDDGGATFVDGGRLPITVATSTIGATIYPKAFGDPDIKYLSGSTYRYFSITVKTFSTTGTAQTMGVHRSTDCGHTWEGPFEIGPATNPHGPAPVATATTPSTCGTRSSSSSIPTPVA